VGKAPTYVRNLSRRLWRTTHAVPVLERIADDRWDLTLTSGRVRLTGSFVVEVEAGRRSWAWRDSDLFVDGVLVPHAVDEQDLARVIVDPDSQLGLGVPDENDRASFVDAPVETAPACVRATLAQIPTQGMPDDLAVRVGTMGPAVWSILITHGSWRVQLFWEFNDGKAWRYKRHAATVHDGEQDLSEQMDGDLSRALTAMFGGGYVPTVAPTMPPPPSMASTRSTPRSTSVEVRKQAVIRT
jgi:hypothetical protein